MQNSTPTSHAAIDTPNAQRAPLLPAPRGLLSRIVARLAARWQARRAQAVLAETGCWPISA